LNLISFQIVNLTGSHLTSVYVDEIDRIITEKRRKQHISYAVSRQNTSRTVADLELKVQQEIEDNYDDNENLGEIETPIEKLRVPTEREKELIAWKLAMDRMRILEDPGAYAYTMVEDLSKTLTNPQGFRENDNCRASCCAYMIMAIFKRFDTELKEWKNRYDDLAEGRTTKKDIVYKNAETQCQLSEATIMEVGTDNSEARPMIDMDEEVFYKKMEKLLHKVVKDTDECMEEERHPAKTYWDIPKTGISLEKNMRRREEKTKDKGKNRGREEKRRDVERSGEEGNPRVGSKPQNNRNGDRTDRSKEGRQEKRKRRRCAGVILELAGGRPADYASVVKKCEKVIPLKELGIPSLDVKRTRGGGLVDGNSRSG